MKPDSGFEMEEEPYDPRELFADIALLITEARTPDLSKKGRVEGPHCPPIQGSREHDCDRHKEQCRKASDILTQHKILLRNNIPMRIDVLLFPSCEHGLREETVVVGAMFSTVDTFILLERWDIQLINKRSSERQEGYVGGRSLLQAVRSYLHFSQLSSWLISTGGAISLRVVYRVYAPGETVGYMFERLPEVHNFPTADLGDAMMRASVTSLPRQNSIMALSCRSPSPNVEQYNRSRKRFSEGKSRRHSPDFKNSRKSPDLKETSEPLPSSSKCDYDYFGYSPPGASNKRHSKDHMEYGKETQQEKSMWGKSSQVSERPPSGKRISDARYKMKEKEMNLTHDSELYAVSHMQTFKMDNLSTVLQEPELFLSECQKDNKVTSKLPSNQGAKMSVVPPSSLPIRKTVPSSYKTAKFPGQLSPQKSHPYKKPTTLFSLSTPPTAFHITKRLPSPKVLMTASKKPEPSVYRKRRLDYNEEKSLLEADCDQLEGITASDMQDLVKPLSPNQLDAYLSSLSNESPEKTSLSQLDDIPMTKCRFFIGENEKSDDVFESPDLEIQEEIIENNRKVTDEQDQDLRLSITTQSLSQESSAGGDNTDISSLSLESLRGEDKSDVTSLSQKSSFKETQQEIKQSLSQESIDTSKEESSNESSMNQDLKAKCLELSNEPCSTPEPHRSARVSGRILFHKSLSTSEVEDDLVSSGKNLKKVIHKLKTELKEPNLEYNEMFLNVFQQKQVKSEEEKYAKDVSSKYSDLKTDKIQNEKPYSSNQEENQNFNNANISIEKPTRHNLDDISIPCSVGAGKADVTDLICDTKSAEICADRSTSPSLDDFSQTSLQNGSLLPSSVNGSVTPMSGSPCFSNGSLSPTQGSGSQSDGSATPVFGSPNVDEEVTHHLKQSMKQSSQKKNSLNKGSPDIGLSLCKQLLQKGFQQCVENEVRSPGKRDYKNLPSPDDIQRFQFNIARSTNALFNTNTGLPTRSSPAPIKKKSSGSFDYDCTLTNVRAIKNAVSCSRLSLQFENKEETVEDPKIISTSAPASTNCLLGNFEESMLNGRIEPVGIVDGFTVEIGAGGSFCPKHVTLPVSAYFFQLSDDNAPSPYLGHVNLEALGKRGYHIPRTGTVQVTLFNPNKTVVKMFVVMYDLSDMPASCQTFLRQRTMYMPVDKNSSEPSFLRYLIHLRFASTKSGKIYLHTDIRLIFARDKFEFDPRVANYELRSFTEGPENPKFSPKR